MAHDVFISYSSRDKEIADMVCDALEKKRAQCWIAPRDIVPGMDWSDAIIDAIVECKVFLLVLSKASNESEQVKREVQNAVSERKHIFTFLIEQVDLTKHMRYFIGTPHWMDALKPPIEPHLARVAQSMRKLLDSMPTPGEGAPARAEATMPAPVVEAPGAVAALAATAPVAGSAAVAHSVAAAAEPAAATAPVIDRVQRPSTPVREPLPALTATAGSTRPRSWAAPVSIGAIVVVGGVAALLAHGKSGAHLPTAAVVSPRPAAVSAPMSAHVQATHLSKSTPAKLAETRLRSHWSKAPHLSPGGVKRPSAKAARSTQLAPEKSSTASVTASTQTSSHTSAVHPRERSFAGRPTLAGMRPHQPGLRKANNGRLRNGPFLERARRRVGAGVTN